MVSQLCVESSLSQRCPPTVTAFIDLCTHSCLSSIYLFYDRQSLLSPLVSSVLVPFCPVAVCTSMTVSTFGPRHCRRQAEAAAGWAINRCLAVWQDSVVGLSGSSCSSWEVCAIGTDGNILAACCDAAAPESLSMSAAYVFQTCTSNVHQERFLVCRADLLHYNHSCVCSSSIHNALLAQ